jgi:hypothetical protein
MSTEIPPLPEDLIGEMEREGLNWSAALAEVIDNAFDAKASRVEIKVTKEAVEIIDDGCGCECPQRMFQKGFSTKRGQRGQMGRYGIGLKHASFYICGLEGDTFITSRFDGVERIVRANWGQIVRQQSWAIDDPRIEPAADGAIGTRIRFIRGKRRWPTGDNLKPVLDELSFTFAPALENGLQIVMNIDGKRQPLTPPPMPEWIKNVATTITVGKKTAIVKAGIVAPETPNKRKGLSYYYAHRNIITGTSKGCNGYPIAHVCGTVELDESWKLGQNKSSVTDDDFETLCQQVLNCLEPMLIEASKQTEHIASTRLRTSLEKRINETFGKARRPGRTDKKRSVKTVGTDRTVKRAAKVSGVGRVLGPVGHRDGAISLEFINDPEDVMCRVELIGDRVTLNRHHPFVAVNEASDNQDALLALIMGSYLHAALTSGDFQKSLVGIENVQESERFAQAMSDNLTELSVTRVVEPLSATGKTTATQSVGTST